MGILDVVVTSLVPLAFLAAIVLFLRARRRAEAAADPPARSLGLRVLQAVVGVMIFGWLVQATVLAYWRWRMPD